MATTVDFRVTWHGSVCIVAPETRAARAWIRDNVAPDVPRWTAGSVALDGRGFDTFAQCADADGLTVGEE